MPPSVFGCSMVNLMWGSIEFRYCSIVSRFPLGMMLKTSSTYLFQSFTGIGSSGARAMVLKYSIYMLATTGEHGEPIAVPCSCLKNLSWKVKTQFSKTNFRSFRSFITSSFSRPMVLHLKEHPYLSLASHGEDIAVAVYRKPTHTDRYLDFNSSHPVSAKRAVVRALRDRAENVCSDPEILAKEIEHLSKVLHYNNYPQWMINQ